LISSKKNAADLRVQPFASVENVQALLAMTKQALEQTLPMLRDRLPLYGIAPSVRSTIFNVLMRELHERLTELKVLVNVHYTQEEKDAIAIDQQLDSLMQQFRQAVE
jgi:hypothetical protein